MTAASVERTLGQILGRLDSLDRSMSKADESRSKLYDKLEVLADKVDDAEAAAKSVAKDLEIIKPTVADINKWRERGVGAVLLISFAAASVGGIVTAFGKKIWTLLNG